MVKFLVYQSTNLKIWKNNEENERISCIRVLKTFYEYWVIVHKIIYRFQQKTIKTTAFLIDYEKHMNPLASKSEVHNTWKSHKK